MVSGIQTNAFKTTSTGANGNVLGRTDTRYLNAPVKQGNIQIEAGWSLSSLTEGTETPVSAYSVSQVSITFAGYGDAKQFTDEELVRQLRGVEGNFMYNIMGAVGENRDDMIITELMTSSNSFYANGNAHDNTDVVVGDIVKARDIKLLARNFQASGQSNGLGAIVFHPNCTFDLFDDDELNLATGNIMTSEKIAMDGYLTSYAGVRIYQHRGIQTATENSITVYKNIALGNNEPFVFAPKRLLEVRFDDEYVRARITTLHFWEMFGVEQVITDSVLVMTASAS